jgi:hypothetical protein
VAPHAPDGVVAAHGERTGREDDRQEQQGDAHVRELSPDHRPLANGAPEVAPGEAARV